MSRLLQVEGEPNYCSYEQDVHEVEHWVGIFSFEGEGEPETYAETYRQADDRGYHDDFLQFVHPNVPPLG